MGDFSVFQTIHVTSTRSKIFWNFMLVGLGPSIWEMTSIWNRSHIKAKMEGWYVNLSRIPVAGMRGTTVTLKALYFRGFIKWYKILKFTFVACSCYLNLSIFEKVLLCKNCEAI